MRYILTHCNLFDGTDDGPFRPDMTVCVDGNRICRVAPSDDITASAAFDDSDFETIDLSGKYLMPGLINLHVHLFGSGKPSKLLAGSGKSSQKGVIDFTGTRPGRHILLDMMKHHIADELASGVTTVRAVGDFHFQDVALRELISKGDFMGPRLLVSGPAITAVGGHGDGTFAIATNDIGELKSLVTTNVSNGVDFIKICVTGGVMDATEKGKPGLVRMTLEQTKAVCDEAHRLGCYVASHTESTEGIRIALEGGVDTVEHGAVLDDDIVKLYHERGSAEICTISPALPLAKLDPKVTQIAEINQYNAQIVMDGIVEGAKRCLQEGIPVGLGTDSSCPFVSQYDMWRELDYFVKYCDVTPGFALRTATAINAQIARISDRCGTVEEGKVADLIVTSTNPLDDIRALHDINMVMARGNLIDKPAPKRIAFIEESLDGLS